MKAAHLCKYRNINIYTCIFVDFVSYDAVFQFLGSFLFLGSLIVLEWFKGVNPVDALIICLIYLYETHLLNILKTFGIHYFQL